MCAAAIETKLFTAVLLLPCCGRRASHHPANCAVARQRHVADHIQVHPAPAASPPTCGLAPVHHPAGVGDIGGHLHVALRLLPLHCLGLDPEGQHAGDEAHQVVHLMLDCEPAAQGIKHTRWSILCLTVSLQPRAATTCRRHQHRPLSPQLCFGFATRSPAGTPRRLPSDCFWLIKHVLGHHAPTVVPTPTKAAAAACLQPPAAASCQTASGATCHP